MKAAEPDKKSVGNRIKAIREKIGLQQKQLAKKLNISNATMCAIEKGNAYPSFDFIFKLYKLFNVNIYYILNGNGDMFVNDNYGNVQFQDIPKEQREFLKDFLKLFRDSELVRYSFQAYFKKYTLENKKLIRMDINSKKANE